MAHGGTKVWRVKISLPFLSCYGQSLFSARVKVIFHSCLPLFFFSLLPTPPHPTPRLQQRPCFFPWVWRLNTYSRIWPENWMATLLCKTAVWSSSDILLGIFTLCHSQCSSRDKLSKVSKNKTQVSLSQSRRYISQYSESISQYSASHHSGWKVITLITWVQK